MVPESEIKKRSDNMDAPDSKEIVPVKEVENKYQTCVSNYEDYTFELDASLAEHAREERSRSSKEADVVNNWRFECNALVQGKCQDTTESSSSFDDVFGVDNGGIVSDDEVVSDFQEVDSFNGHAKLFSMRKKGLTSHWRTYIQPLMWRCKWIELQIKKLNMQERNYAKELTKYEQEESFQVERPTDICSREVPFSDGRRTHQVLKRRKRKRIEDIVDVTTYMSQHNLFSYYGTMCSFVFSSLSVSCNLSVMIYDLKEFVIMQKIRELLLMEFVSMMNGGTKVRELLDNNYCKEDVVYQLLQSASNAAYLIFPEKVNCIDEFEMDDISSWLESSEMDESLELLRKIGIIKGQVSNLKTRLDKVMGVNAAKFSYAANPSLLVPSNASTSSGPDSASPPNNGDRVAVGPSYIASQLISQYHMRDVVPPESAVSNHGEVAHLSDIIERRNQAELGGLCHIEDEILIYNHRMRDGIMNTFEEVEMQPPAAVRVDQENPVPLDHNVLTDDQPPKRTRSISELTTPMTRRSQRRRKLRRF
ncbi:hypothetical protein Leryth_017467 [Lithospermum erythrorhizon]|nr:hypothetical protein Leryth_017467 [Lithospermum erythrorhizon]